MTTNERVPAIATLKDRLRNPWLHLKSAAHALRRPRQSLLHRAQFTILASRGYAGFAGGVFNPGVAAHPEGGYTVAFKGQNQHWIDALKYAPENFMRGGMVLWHLDDAMATPGQPVIADFADDAHGPAGPCEDFRLFRYGDRLLVNHPCTRYDSNHDRRDEQLLSELNRDSVRILGTPAIDFEPMAQERNWLYYDDGARLLLFYRVQPYRVLVLTDEQNWRFSTLIDRPAPAPLNDPLGNGAFVSFSTNPVDYDAHHLLVLIHQKKQHHGGRSYLNWGVLLDRQTLLPTHMSATPLFDGAAARGRLRGVLYVTAAVPRRDDVVFFCGEGDSLISRCSIARAELDNRWQPLTWEEA